MKLSPRHLLKKRLFFVVLIFLASIIIINARLIHLQINLTMKLFERGQKNFMRFENIASPRGNILDSNGSLLATNRPLVTLCWQGTGNRTLTKDQETTINLLSALIPVDNAEIIAAERLSKKIAIHEDVSGELLSRLSEQFPNNPNVTFATTFKRFYPHGAIASHLLGYLCVTYDEQGTMGLEKVLDQDLKGIPGKLLRMINSTGKHLEEKEIKKALAGKDVITTINLEKQYIAETIFPPTYAGALIVMNPRTGSIEALVSRPAFDPNLFLQPLNISEWQKLQENQPFLNRAFNAYPPASLFKLVTISAALEHKLINPYDTWFCSGSIHFGGRDYHCNRHSGHGRLTLMEALAQSCNIPFFEIGKKISVDQLADYAHRFGLGIKTESVFPEKQGLIPTSSWKRQYKGEEWWPGETLSATIGQTFLLATPIQIARMVAGIFEGYLVKPRILMAEPIHKEKMTVSDETLKFLRQTMKMVTEEGTGHLLKLNNVEIYAKTGTAQVSSLRQRRLYNDKKYLEHAWLLAHIKYKKHEPFVLVILLENAGSAKLATLTAVHFVQNYCHLIDSGILPLPMMNSYTASTHHS